VSPNHNPKYKTLLQRLKRARRDAGLTQAEAAVLVGRPQSDISKIETNNLTLDPIELWELARAYGRPVTDFLNFPEDGETEK
jgi:transcriptional regulator with XRE-family HTH domain